MSYLLGTHHFAPLSCVDSIAELPEIIRGVDKLYGEIDMSIMTDPARMMPLQGMLMAPADSTLDKVLTTAQLDSVANYINTLSGTQVPMQMLCAVKPAVLTTQIAQLLTLKTFPDLNPAEQIDITMQNRAREAGKPVAGLETIDFQMDMLYNRPISEQAEGLMKSIREPQKEEEMSRRLANAYRSHDFDTILAIIRESSEDDAESMDRLIYSRNASWIKRLSAEMPGESLLVVVGAGHLPGPKGVIGGLRECGFKVTPVK